MKVILLTGLGAGYKIDLDEVPIPGDVLIVDLGGGNERLKVRALHPVGSKLNRGGPLDVITADKLGRV